MKKFLLLMLSSIMALSMVACDKSSTKVNYQIEGTIKSNGKPLNNIIIVVDGNDTVVTDSNGHYVIKNVDFNDSINLVPISENYKFNPSNLDVEFARDDADFNAELIKSKVDDGSSNIVQDKTKIATPTENLFDGFDNGISPKGKWDIRVGGWGGNSAFRGSVPQNVKYTSDGTLVLQSKGLYYPNPSLRRTGACIISKKTFGPGRMDVAAKISPRLGMCCAIWGFYYEEGQDGSIKNHEIDIEFPGKKGGNGGRKGLDSVMFTNYQTRNGNQHNEIYLPDKGVSPQNDGNWHKYSIEWSVKEKFVKYYIDDVLLAEHRNASHVPTYEQQLYIGVWEPNGWAGVPEYSEGDFLLDWVAYTSYDETEADGVKKPDKNFLEKKVANAKLFPTEPYDMASKAEFISNGDFEINLGAWKKTSDSNEGSHIVPTDYHKSNSVYRLQGNTNIYQSILAIYDNYAMDFSAKVKTENIDANGEAYLSCNFYDDRNNNILTKKIPLSKSSDFQLITEKVVAPQGCVRMDVSAVTKGDNTKIYLDDVSLTQNYYRAEEK